LVSNDTGAPHGDAVTVVAEMTALYNSGCTLQLQGALPYPPPDNPIDKMWLGLWKRGWRCGGNYCIGKSKKAGVAGQEAFEARVLSLAISSLSTPWQTSALPLYSPPRTPEAMSWTAEM